MARDPFEDGDTLAEDLGMFEAAVHARPLALDKPVLAAVVLAPDGSNQDATARTWATAMAARAGCPVHEQRGAASASEILQACRKHQAGLLVVPVPFGQDIQELRDESLGSIIDMLLQESVCPLLCVRELMDEAAVQLALNDILLPIHGGDETCARAASWALHFLAEQGQLQLLAVADQDVLDEARELLGDAIAASASEPDALSRAMTQEVASVVGAVQRRGNEAGLTVSVDVKVGRFVSVVLDEANQRPHLLVTGASKDRTSPTFHRATDLILGAKYPVLVV
ncbi:MAG: universal stress protein [Planctomycetes bacterium]|nr:universal stress protein [Planctomycetota bacterium]